MRPMLGASREQSRHPHPTRKCSWEAPLHPTTPDFRREPPLGGLFLQPYPFVLTPDFEQAYPSHGWGHRFNPYRAHHPFAAAGMVSAVFRQREQQASPPRRGGGHDSLFGCAAYAARGAPTIPCHKLPGLPLFRAAEIQRVSPE